MASAWFIIDNGQEHGPFTPGRMRDLVHQGKVTGASMVRKDGSDQVISAQNVPGLLSANSSGTGRHRRRKTKAGETEFVAHLDNDNNNNDSGDSGEKPMQVAKTFDAFAKDEDYIERVSAQLMGQGFYMNLAKSYGFAFSTNAVAFMIAYIILGMLLSTLGVFFVTLWWGFEALFLFFSLWFVLYACAYVMRILLRSAEGDRKAPTWPELGGLLEYILGPAVLLLSVLFLLNILFIFHMWGDLSILPNSLGILDSFRGIDTFLFHGLDLLFRLPTDGIGIITKLPVFLIGPMVIVQVATKGGFLGLHPVPMFERLSKSFPAYLVLMLVIALLYFLMVYAWSQTCLAYGLNETPCFAYMVGKFLPQLSYLDMLGFWAACIIPTVCCVFLQFSAMGIFYHSESEKW